MTLREEFEKEYAVRQSMQTGFPVQAADVATDRDGESYRHRDTAIAWKWFCLGANHVRSN